MPPVSIVNDDGHELSETEIKEFCERMRTPESIAFQETLAALENMDRLATHQTRYNKGRPN